MTRINDDTSGVRDAQLQEQERAAEKRSKEKASNDKQEFSRLVEQNRQSSQKGKHEQDTQRGHEAGQQAAASSRLLARQGIQANTFQQTLQRQGGESLGEKQLQTKSRDTESTDSKKSVEHRDSETTQQRVDKQQDRLAPISRDDRQGGGKGESGDGGGGKEMGSQSDGFGAAGQGIAQAQGAQAGGPAQVQGSAAPQLPQAVIQQIVERVMVGVNQEGLSQFRIEFKDNVLSGSVLTLTAKDGKVSAHFETRDVNVKRLLKASEGPLARAFGHKGLTLEKFEVSGP
jgi:hypothetical protein